LRVRSLTLTKNSLGNLAQQGQVNPGLIIALQIEERLNQLALVDANQLSGLTLEIPDSNIREQLKSRTESALGKPGPARHAPQPSGLTIEKTDQTISLAQRKSAQDDCFRLLERHPLVGAPTGRESHPSKSRDEIQNLVTYHTKRFDAIENRAGKEDLHWFSWRATNQTIFFGTRRRSYCPTITLDCDADEAKACLQTPCIKRITRSSGICLEERVSLEDYQTLVLILFSCSRAVFSYSVLMFDSLPVVDIAGVGLNATDTIIRLPQFPAFNSKMEFRTSEVLSGGQVASAMVACSAWGLKTRYVGKIGDDPSGLLQQAEMEREGVESHWIIAPNCQSQSSFILVDETTGERTILWKRDPRLEILPEEIRREWVVQSRLLHIDGHDCAGASAAAGWAREAHIPVIADLDNLYPAVEVLLRNVDYLISSREFPERLSGEQDLLISLPRIFTRFGCRLAAATLGDEGVLAWDGSKFHYCPAFEVVPVDTTGAGDIFHAGFAYALIQGWGLGKALEFSCAAAGLACTGAGARGGIASVDQIETLMRKGPRRKAAFSQGQLEVNGTVR
jgi:sulfofructose kinase